MISSGDERASKEYVHPRATIMGTLGKYSRVEEPLVFVTELVAFFSLSARSRNSRRKTTMPPPRSKRRLSDFSGEAYTYTMDDYGKPVPAPVRMV